VPHRSSFTHQTPLTLLRNLNPGGYLELQEFALPLSDDGTLTPEHALQRSMDLLSEAAKKHNHAFVDLHQLSLFFLYSLACSSLPTSYL
jgi:hypothetical protein